MKRENLLVLLPCLLLVGAETGAQPPTAAELQTRLKQACPAQAAGGSTDSTMHSKYCKNGSDSSQGMAINQTIADSWTQSARMCKTVCRENPITAQTDHRCDDASYQSIDLEASQSLKYNGVLQQSGITPPLSNAAIQAQAASDHKRFHAASACDEETWSNQKVSSRLAMVQQYQNGLTTSLQNATALLNPPTAAASVAKTTIPGGSLGAVNPSALSGTSPNTPLTSEPNNGVAAMDFPAAAAAAAAISSEAP